MTTIFHDRIEGEIGRGGMRVVYRAVDTKLGRPVAIEVLPPDATVGAGGASDSPGGSSKNERHRRFLQEARSASALNHPHIVTIYEVDEYEGTTFIAMELVAGTPLDKLLAKGPPLPVTTALEYAAQIAAALEAALELLGPPEPLKKSVVLEGGHVPQDIRGLFRATLDWFDTHLGVVR